MHPFLGLMLAVIHAMRNKVKLSEDRQKGHDEALSQWFLERYRKNETLPGTL